jgi:AraC family transcriptional regulator, arabinose operon regulatory protein
MNNTSFPFVPEKDKQLPFYLLSIGCDYIQERVDRVEGYPTYQWIQTIDGIGELTIEDKKETVGPNQGIFLFPDVPHKYHSISGEWRVNWISFAGDGTGGFLKAAGIKRSAVYSIKNSELLSSKMKKILVISQSHNSLKNIEASGILYELLMDIIMYTSRNSEGSAEQQFLKLSPVLEYIELNYSSVITLEELAQIIHVTPQHLCVLFKKITGVRPFEYINSVRISKSKDLIINSIDNEINSIAKSVGYDNTSYFCSLFKKMEGISPGRFKKLYW